MNTYFATFTSGIQPLVPQMLSCILKDISIKQCSDGFIIFASDEHIEKIQHIRFLNNIFSLIKTFKHVEGSTKSINGMVKKAIEDDNLFYHINRKIPQKKQTFRIMVVRENQMVKHDRNVLDTFEQRILAENRNLSIDRSLPDIEFWFYIRREQDAYFGIRLTYHTEYAKTLQKGELKPEIAYVMNYLSAPQKDEMVMDPFSGSGAILLERSISFQTTHSIAGDIDDGKIAYLQERFKKNKNISVKKLDALHLDALEDESLDSIVTDPPWGVTVGKDLDMVAFYTAMLKEFHRILKDKGKIVLLVAHDGIVQKVLSKNNRFRIQQTLHILVSGQKASIVTLEKNP